MLLSNLVTQMLAGQAVSDYQMAQAMADITSGVATDTQIGGFLVALKMSGQLNDSIMRLPRVVTILKTLW